MTRPVTRLALSIACLVLVTAVLGWILGWPGAEPVGAAQPSAIRLESDHSPHHVALPDAVAAVVHPLAPRSQVDAVSEQETADAAAIAAPDVVVPHETRNDNPHRMYVSNEYFETMYGNASLHELRIAKATLEPEVFDLSSSAVDDCFARGLGEQEILPVGDETSEWQPVPVGPNHGLLISARTNRVGDDQKLVRTVLVPWDEYSGFYDKQDELFWLIGEIGRREQGEGR